MEYTPDPALERLGEQEARALLERLGLKATLRAFEYEMATRCAVELLRQRVDRGVIRDRLMQRYGMSAATAYRLRGAALERLHLSHTEAAVRQDRDVMQPHQPEQPEQDIPT